MSMNIDWPKFTFIFLFSVALNLVWISVATYFITVLNWSTTMTGATAGSFVIGLFLSRIKA
jgi:hypothetical protein